MNYVLIKNNQIINVVEVNDINWLNARVSEGTCDSFDILTNEDGSLKYVVLELPQDLENGS